MIYDKNNPLASDCASENSRDNGSQLATPPRLNYKTSPPVKTQ